MTNAQLALLLQEPVPVQDGQPGHCGVTTAGRGTGAGWRLEWLVGLAKRPWGPTFEHVQDACAAAHAVNANVEEQSR